VLKEEYSDHIILKISLQYLLAFHNLNYLNLNVHFQSEQVIKLRFWL